MATYVEEDTPDGQCDNFKPVFKRYKRRDVPLDLSDVIDFDNDKNLDKVKNHTLTDTNSAFPGLKPVSEWKAYTLKSHPGFIFIVNPFKQGAQRYWVNRLIKDYPSKPSVRNIDAYMKVDDAVNIWKHSSETHSDNITSKDCLMMKLRWATMGYHYDWNTQKYYKDRHAPFPEDMSGLGRHVAAAIGYPHFSPEAAVLNYYHLDSTLSGHTDHSEFDHSAPLISFSLGQECIFLIGGETKATEPSAVFLRSGDICIMSGEARLVYHAVPRILAAPEQNIAERLSLPPTQKDYSHCGEGLNRPTEATCCNCDTNVNDKDWHRVEQYLSQTRINFNIRQVLAPDRDFPVET